MEELRSTDILDREIQSDAKKKAENILKKADRQCADILNSVGKTIEDARTAKEDFYSKKLDSFRKNQDASLPLEKQRFEVSFIQKAIIENINRYLEEIGEDKRMQLVMNQLEQKKALLADRKINAWVYGFDLAKMKKSLTVVLGKNLLSCQATDFGRISVENDDIEKKEGVIIESDDKGLKVRLTLTELVDTLFENHRQELCDSLFGKGGLA